MIPHNIKKIGEGAFESCKTEFALHLPPSDRLPTIGDKAFDDLATLYFQPFDSKYNIEFFISLEDSWNSNASEKTLTTFLYNPTYANFKAIREDKGNKINIAIAYSMSEHEDKGLYQNYIKRLGDYALNYIINVYDYKVLDFFIDKKMFSLNSVNKCLDNEYIHKNEPEKYVMLMEYKKEIKGYKDKDDRFKL